MGKEKKVNKKIEEKKKKKKKRKSRNGQTPRNIPSGLQKFSETTEGSKET